MRRRGKAKDPRMWKATGSPEEVMTFSSENRAFTSHPSILDVSDVCDTTDCAEHPTCRKIREIARMREWWHTPFLKDGMWRVRVE